MQEIGSGLWSVMYIVGFYVWKSGILIISYN